MIPRHCFSLRNPLNGKTRTLLLSEIREIPAVPAVHLPPNELTVPRMCEIAQQVVGETLPLKGKRGGPPPERIRRRRDDAFQRALIPPSPRFRQPFASSCAFCGPSAFPIPLPQASKCLRSSPPPKSQISDLNSSRPRPPPVVLRVFAPQLPSPFVDLGCHGASSGWSDPSCSSNPSAAHASCLHSRRSRFLPRRLHNPIKLTQPQIKLNQRCDMKTQQSMPDMDSS